MTDAPTNDRPDRTSNEDLAATALDGLTLAPDPYTAARAGIVAAIGEARLESYRAGLNDQTGGRYREDLRAWYEDGHRDGQLDEDSRDERILALEAEVKDADLQHGKTIDERDNLKARGEKLEADVTRLSDCVLDAAGAERIAKAELGELEDTLRSVQAENDLRTARIAELEEQFAELEEIENTRRLRVVELEEAQWFLRPVEGAGNVLECEGTTWRAECASVKEELEHAIRPLSRHATGWKDRAQSAEGKLESLRGDVRELRDQNEALILAGRENQR